MKKIFLSLVLVLSVAYSFAQANPNDSIVEKHKNIITVDATYLLRQFFNLNTNSFYQNPYIIGYRRKFGRNAMRVNIGGGVYNYTTRTNDTLVGKNSNNNLTVALGYERYNHLGRRWAFYYGIDALYNLNLRNYQSITSDGLYTYIEKDKANAFGVAPFLGIIFKINQRIDLATETNFAVSYKLDNDKRYYIPSTQWDMNSKTSGIESQYIAPASIILRIHF